jgi:hypothetical protein
MARCKLQQTSAGAQHQDRETLTNQDKLLAAPHHACHASGSELDLDQAVVTAEMPIR